MQTRITRLLGNRIRQARTSRNLSLNEVASRARISVATLSRIERDKQGLDLGLFLILCRILKTSAQELIGEEPEENVDPLAVRIANLQRTDRIQLWRDLAAARKNGRRTAARSQIRALSDEVEELLAQLEFVRTEMEAVHNHVRRGGGRP